MPHLAIYQDSKNPGRCRSCGAAITWAETTNGRRLPLNPPVVAVHTQGELSAIGRVVDVIDTDITRPHFATCPQAKDWRNPR